MPFVTEVGEAVRGVRNVAEMTENADDVGDALKVADKDRKAIKDYPDRTMFGQITIH